nr:PREDICTED: uncharacterized protein LOC109041576 [Bemisia tabaci]
MYSFKVLIIFALASMVILAHLAIGKPSVSSNAGSDESSVETVNDEEPSLSFTGHHNETAEGTTGRGCPRDSENLTKKCGKRGAYCDVDCIKCCKGLRCYADYRSRKICH